MNSRRLSLLVPILGLFCLASPAPALAEDAAALCAKLNKAVEDGQALARIRIQEGRTTYQIQIKARRSQGKSDVVYQLLWPVKEKGKAFVVSQGSGAATASLLTPPDKISKPNVTDGFFGTNLAYVDVVENFFRWKSQSITGEESIGRIKCVILESKPGSGDSSPYGMVRSWIDTTRSVPMRVEKYNKSGQIVRRIDTDRVIKADNGNYIPMDLSIRVPGSKDVTKIEGSKIRYDVKLSDSHFSTAGLGNTSSSD